MLGKNGATPTTLQRFPSKDQQHSKDSALASPDETDLFGVGSGGGGPHHGAVGAHQGSTGSHLTKSPKQATISLALIAACLFQLPMGMIWSTIGLIVLPYEAEKFYPERHSGFLGVLLTIAGTSQIISPIVGKLSDEHRSSWGRRRPFMFVGTVVVVVGVMGLSYTSGLRLIFWYAVALFISQVGRGICGRRRGIWDFFWTRRTPPRRNCVPNNFGLNIIFYSASTVMDWTEPPK